MVRLDRRDFSHLDVNMNVAKEMTRNTSTMLTPMNGLVRSRSSLLCIVNRVSNFLVLRTVV